MLTYEAHARADPATAWAFGGPPRPLERGWGRCACTTGSVRVPTETALAVTYGPVVELLVRNLARTAERAG